jgi:hypothetical protein
MKLSAQLEDIDMEGEGDEDMDGPMSPGACIEGLALTLIYHLSSSEGGSEEGKLPKVPVEEITHDCCHMRNSKTTLVLC